MRYIWFVLRGFSIKNDTISWLNKIWVSHVAPLGRPAPTRIDLLAARPDLFTSLPKLELIKRGLQQSPNFFKNLPRKSSNIFIISTWFEINPMVSWTSKPRDSMKGNFSGKLGLVITAITGYSSSSSVCASMATRGVSYCKSNYSCG